MAINEFGLPRLTVTVLAIYNYLLKYSSASPIELQKAFQVKSGGFATELKNLERHGVVVARVATGKSRGKGVEVSYWLTSRGRRHARSSLKRYKFID